MSGSILLASCCVLGFTTPRAAHRDHNSVWNVVVLAKSRVQVKRWTADDSHEWSALISGSDQANLAQLPQWFTVIKNAYRHVPLYLQAEDAEGQVAVLPSFLVRRPLLGTCVTSMPFLDAGGPCSPSAELGRVLVEALVEEALCTGARLVELRCTEEIDLPVPARAAGAFSFKSFVRARSFPSKLKS